jgi:hypothetical protein
MIQSHYFRIHCGDLEAQGQLLLLKQCCYLWLGAPDAAPVMDELAVAAKVPQSEYPVSSLILDEGEGDSNLGQSIARSVARKLDLQCFVSYNLDERYDKFMNSVIMGVLTEIMSCMS